MGSKKKSKLPSNRDKHLTDFLLKVYIATERANFDHDKTLMALVISSKSYTWGWEACASNVRKVLKKKK